MKAMVQAALAVIMFCAMIGMVGYHLSITIPNTPKVNTYYPR